MLRKLISESYWLEDSQLDEIYSYFLDVSSLCSYFCQVLYLFFEPDVGDFKLASISGITGSQIHCISPGRLLADWSRWKLSGKKYCSTWLIYDRFMTSTSANFENPYRMSLSLIENIKGKGKHVKVKMFDDFINPYIYSLFVYLRYTKHQKQSPEFIPRLPKRFKKVKKLTKKLNKKYLIPYTLYLIPYTDLRRA